MEVRDLLWIRTGGAYGMESDTGTAISEVNKNFLDIVDSLIGCIPDDGMDLLEYREERLEKYKNID